MNALLWLLLSPVVFVFPGLYPARRITGTLFSWWTLVWAAFFSIVAIPPLAFGLAMILGTTVRPALILPLAVLLGLPGLFFPRQINRADSE